MVYMEAQQHTVDFLEMLVILEKWKLFKDLTIEPTTTVDVTDSSYSKGVLVVDIEGMLQVKFQTYLTTIQVT